jgi:hypothetical protein
LGEILKSSAVGKYDPVRVLSGGWSLEGFPGVVPGRFRKCPPIRTDVKPREAKNLISRSFHWIGGWHGTCRFRGGKDVFERRT